MAKKKSAPKAAKPFSPAIQAHHFPALDGGSRCDPRRENRRFPHRCGRSEDKPEEYVRQNLEKALVRTYKYAPVDCTAEFQIKMGSKKPRVDVVVFQTGHGNRPQRALLGPVRLSRPSSQLET